MTKARSASVRFAAPLRLLDRCRRPELGRRRGSRCAARCALGGAASTGEERVVVERPSQGCRPGRGARRPGLLLVPQHVVARPASAARRTRPRRRRPGPRAPPPRSGAGPRARSPSAEAPQQRRARRPRWRSSPACSARATRSSATCWARRTRRRRTRCRPIPRGPRRRSTSSVLVDQLLGQPRRRRRPRRSARAGSRKRERADQRPQRRAVAGGHGPVDRGAEVVVVAARVRPATPAGPARSARVGLGRQPRRTRRGGRGAGRGPRSAITSRSWANCRMVSSRWKRDSAPSSSATTQRLVDQPGHQVEHGVEVEVVAAATASAAAMLNPPANTARRRNSRCSSSSSRA